MSVEIQRRIISILKHRNKTNKGNDETSELAILLHPDNLDRLKNDDQDHLLEIQKVYNAKLSFKADYSYHAENFKILDAKSGTALR